MGAQAKEQGELCLVAQEKEAATNSCRVREETLTEELIEIMLRVLAGWYFF